MLSTFSRNATLIILVVLILCCSGCVTLECGSCSADLSGTWNYYVGKSGTSDPALTGTVTLTQTGHIFSGANEGWTINGTVFGNDVHLTMVVTGEALMGYVLRAEGNFFDGQKIATVFTTSDGKSGYWNAYRP